MHVVSTVARRVKQSYNTRTGRFIMFSLNTNTYNKKTKEPTLMELFIATGKLNFSFDNGRCPIKHFSVVFIMPVRYLDMCYPTKFQDVCLHVYTFACFS
jgi:hypothetical protein